MVELWAVQGAVLLGLVHIGAASFAFKAQAGNSYTVGPRDEDVTPAGRAGRLARASRNFFETFPLFLAVVFVAYAMNAFGPLSFAGSIAYLVGRVAYLPLYAAGVPWLRTISWNVATAGLALVGLQPLFSP